MGNHQWNVIVASGHSSEHACLFCEELNIFICGDILLPRISPNVSVLPNQPDGNPLADWFESLEKIKTLLPEDVLVLPSHGYPYRGAHERIKELIDEHHLRLDKLHKFCKNPQRAVDVFPVLFDRKIDSKSIILAIGESLSHLNYLIGQGLITKTSDKNGIKYYSQSD
jgi:glyoxylase-like metal-dependent hydrolase (beta-lactamase superfamily II)